MKRILVYHHFDGDNLIEPYVVHFLSEMKKFGCKILFASNSDLSSKELKKISKLTDSVTLRENRGYDFASWKQVLLEHGKDYFLEYDQVILANSTIYGPLFDLTDIFAKMEKTGCDFWTPTKHTAAYGIPEHVQPYFFVANRKVIENDTFWSFWASIKEDYKDMWTLIWDGEIRLSYELASAGLTYAVVAELDDTRELRDLGHYEPFVLHAAAYLIETQKLPFVKVKAFYTLNSRPFNGTQMIFEALDYTKSTYPRSLIVDHQRRVSPLSWMKNMPDTLLIPNETGQAKPLSAAKKKAAVTALKAQPKRRGKASKTAPIGVFAHLYYPETMDYFLDNISKIPVPFDLNLTTSSPKIQALASKLTSKQLPSLHECEVRLVENRGRDIGPWITEFSDKQMLYDIALKLHVKKHSQQPALFSHLWNRYMFDSLMNSEAYISAIVDAFESDPELGLVFPPYPPIYNMMYPLGYTGSEEDQFHRQAVFDRLGITPPTENSQPVFSAGGMSWYRPKALAKLFGTGFTIEDFPEEPFPTSGTIGHGLERAIPYIAQAQGYHYRLAVPQKTLLNSFQMYEDKIMSVYQPTPEGEVPQSPVPGVKAAAHTLAHSMNRSYNARFPRVARHTHGLTSGLKKLLFKK